MNAASVVMKSFFTIQLPFLTFETVKPEFGDMLFNCLTAGN